MSQDDNQESHPVDDEVEFNVKVIVNAKQSSSIIRQAKAASKFFGDSMANLDQIEE